ncbi:hypothetical protein V2J56_10310 [Georgenia sp. MJ206]|uniref:hypothetical protein n=1 Tax=Georgenia wangjunii TaxID=3117730 RepID=UPI002F2633C0
MTTPGADVSVTPDGAAAVASDDDASGPTAPRRTPGPPTGAPARPVPPRSRLTDHLLTGLLTPLLTAAAVWLLGAGALLTAGGPGTGELDDGAVRLAGAALLLAVVAFSARWSSLGLAVSGALVLLAGLGAWARPAAVADLLADDGAAYGTGQGAAALAGSGLLPVLGAVMLGLAAGAHGARRAGRAQERTEETLRAARSAAADDGVAPPVPPRSRAAAHWTAVAAGVLLLPALLLALRTSATVLPTPPADTGHLVLHVLAAAGLALVAASVRLSSLGAQIGGGLWGLAVGGYLLLRTETVPGLTALGLGDLPADAVDLARTGILPVLGALLLAGGLAAHEARRAGRRHERTEIALERARHTVDA